MWQCCTCLHDLACVLTRKTFMELCPSLIHTQPSVPLHEDGQPCFQGKVNCNAWLASRVQHALAGIVDGS